MDAAHSRALLVGRLTSSLSYPRTFVPGLFIASEFVRHLILLSLISLSFYLAFSAFICGIARLYVYMLCLPYPVRGHEQTVHCPTTLLATRTISMCIVK